jgi:hypothetical protein
MKQEPAEANHLPVTMLRFDDPAKGGSLGIA